MVKNHNPTKRDNIPSKHQYSLVSLKCLSYIGFYFFHVEKKIDLKINILSTASKLTFLITIGR